MFFIDLIIALGQQAHSLFDVNAYRNPYKLAQIKQTRPIKFFVRSWRVAIPIQWCRLSEALLL